MFSLYIDFVSYLDKFPYSTLNSILNNGDEILLTGRKRKARKMESKPGMAAHTCSPSTWEAETGGSQV